VVAVQAAKLAVPAPSKMINIKAENKLVFFTRSSGIGVRTSGFELLGFSRTSRDRAEIHSLVLHRALYRP
jgi:hypothetical protein